MLDRIPNDILNVLFDYLPRRHLYSSVIRTCKHVHERLKLKRFNLWKYSNDASIISLVSWCDWLSKYPVQKVYLMIQDAGDIHYIPTNIRERAHYIKAPDQFKSSYLTLFSNLNIL